jgi:ubiquinone/menaquinone biosynthesis C-methylase UbiE
VKAKKTQRDKDWPMYNARSEPLTEPRTDWRSYDGVAETYARVAERQCFAQPARDLVALLNLAPGSRVLDVGAGTGAVAALAVDIVGRAGLVVALEPALGMLRVLKKRCEAHPVAGKLPGLPHPDGSFDAVAAGFVLTHVQDSDRALTAMTKVLRPGGRLAVSAWARSEAQTPPGRIWQAVAKEFVRDEDLQTALSGSLPSQDSFSDPASLATMLAAADLAGVLVREVRYSHRMTVRAFIELRGISMSGRFIESVLPADEWARLQRKAARRLAGAHGAEVRFQVRANIGVGSKAD